LNYARLRPLRELRRGRPASWRTCAATNHIARACLVNSPTLPSGLGSDNYSQVTT